MKSSGPSPFSTHSPSSVFFYCELRRFCLLYQVLLILGLSPLAFPSFPLFYSFINVCIVYISLSLIRGIVSFHPFCVPSFHFISATLGGRCVTPDEADPCPPLHRSWNRQLIRCDELEGGERRSVREERVGVVGREGM